MTRDKAIKISNFAGEMVCLVAQILEAKYKLPHNTLLMPDTKANELLNTFDYTNWHSIKHYRESIAKLIAQEIA